MPDLTNNTDLEFTESGGNLTGKALRLNDGTNTATAEEVRALLDADLVADEGSVPGILYGTATDLDGDGNPTPDTTTHDPTVLSEGTLLFATSGPTAQDNGTGVTTTYSGVDMRFRVESSAWVWDGGQFTASNSNGSYTRSADGTQECWIRRFNGGNYTTAAATWTFPAAFVDNQSAVNPTPDNTSFIGLFTHSQTATTVRVDAASTSSSLAANVIAKGRWV